jgi:hypothetical protein
MADNALSPQDRDIVARTMLSEAGQDGPQGMAAVAAVIKNRLQSGQYGASPSEVVQQPNAFSAWSLPKTDSNNPSKWSPKSPQYQQASSIADSVFSGQIPDPTGGASHYLNPAIVTAQKGKLPDWAQGQPTAMIGKHAFYAPTSSPQMLAFNSPSQSDIDDTAGLFGLKPKAAIPAPQQSTTPLPPAAYSGISPMETVVSPSDIADTAKVLGLNPGAPKAALPTPMQPAPEAQSRLPSDQEAIAQARAKTIGFPDAVAQGMPVVGPALSGAESATGAAISPLLAGNPNNLDYASRFNREWNINQEAQRLYNEQYPYLSTAGNLLGAGLATGPFAQTTLGAAALGLPNATRLGATAGGRLYTGALGGATIGGADSALRGDSPITGAEVGGVLGGLGPIAAEGIGATIGAGLNALRGGQGALTDVNPIARNWLSTALANETPASIAAARARMGPQGFLGDLNPAMTELAAGIANRAEPPASSIVGEAYRTRQAAQRGVIEDSLNRNIGNPVDIEDFKGMITENQKAAATPLYQQFRTMQVHPTPEIQALIPRLDAAGAFDQASKLAGINGDSVNRNFFVGGPQKAFPTTQSWDYIKRSLDSKIDQAYNGGDNTTARALIGLKNDVINAVGKTPAGQVWNQARSEFADRAALLDQIDAGTDTFLGGRSGTTASQLRQELQSLNGPELAARIVGLRNAADQVMGATQNGDTTLRNKFLAPNNQEKLRLMLGDQRAQDLTDTMQQQEYLSGQQRYVNPRAGSATAPRNAAISALDAPALPHWNPNLTEPLSFIPPSWIDALRPSTVLQGGRDASYAGARQQLAPLLTQQEGPGLSALLDAIRAEAVGRGNALARGNMARTLTGAAIAGPLSQALRMRGGFSTLPALSGPAQ